MLTAELVRASRRGTRLVVSELKGKAKQRALELATIYVELAREQVGGRHEQLKEAWASVEVGPRERKLALGLQKLIEDRCEFEAQAPIDPRELRSHLFVVAAEQRRELGRDFDPRRVFEQVAEAHGLEPESLEAALYSDLHSQQVLLSVSAPDPAVLVLDYVTASTQAVLLRAVKVIAHVRCQDPANYRALFRSLKFRRLIFTIEREEGGYRIVIDGPFSMFESVTKYGLALALVFPDLCRADELRLRAQLRWGKAREALHFEFDHVANQPHAVQAGPIGDEVTRLVASLEKLGSPWRVSQSDRVLDLPGVGLCVPDLCLERDGQRVYVEVMGFWSRDAVFKRVELVERGMTDKVVFAVSSRLRVSEAVLDERACSALYVYKGVISARTLLDKVQALADGGG